MSKNHLDFRTVEDLLRHAADASGWVEGDEPLVMISYASRDTAVVELLRTNLDPALSMIDGGGRPYYAWDFEAPDQGTAPGGHFPTELAEKMWRCRAAFIIWSQDYANSFYCRHVELPFLLWRLQNSGLLVFLIHVNETTIDESPLWTPAFRCESRSYELTKITDDRNPNYMPRGDPTKGLWLEELMHSNIPKAKQRIAAYVGRVCRMIRKAEAERIGATFEEAGPEVRSLSVRAVEPDEPGTSGLAAPAAHRVGQAIAALVVIAIAAAAAIAVANFADRVPPAPTHDLDALRRALDLEVMRRACATAALSPDDPDARGAGVGFDSLDPARLPDCERAVAALPNDGAVHFQYGRLLEKAGRRREAFDAYLRAYRLGHPLAANNIGVAFRDHAYMFRNLPGEHHCDAAADCDRRALTWFATADNGRNAAAAFNFAMMYEQRRGVDGRSDDLGCAGSRCEAAAANHYREAVDLGDAEAAYRLARLAVARGDRLADADKLDDGWCATRADCDGVAADMARRAADADLAPAQALLGGIYEEGRGVLGRPPPLGCDTAAACDAAAVEWYRRAATKIPAAAARLRALTAPTP